MKSRHAVTGILKELRSSTRPRTAKARHHQPPPRHPAPQHPPPPPPPLPRPSPHAAAPVTAPESASESVFARIPLPRTPLFEEPAAAVVWRVALTRGRKTARFLLLNRPKYATPVADPPYGGSPISSRILATRMLNYVQIATAPTADTSGTTLLLHFDTQRYLFGHVAEGTQRAFVQRKIAINKLENIFVSGPVSWRSAGGLLGMVLTLADVVTSSREQTAVNKIAKQHKNKPGQGPTAAQTAAQTAAAVKAEVAASALHSLHVHAGKNLSHLLATARRFIFRRGLPLRPHEVRSDPRSGPHDAAAQLSSEPDWKDENIKVWYMPVSSDQGGVEKAASRKRSHDEFVDGAKATSTAPREDDDNSQQVAEAIVAHMFDSDWTPDALVETTLHRAKLPAKLFVRDKNGHLQSYRGPMPGGAQEVPDIPVLVRQPWPGAMISKLPPSEPSKQSMCYIVKPHDRRGRFDPKAAERLGVNKKDYRYLTQMQSVKGKDGMEVTPEMVLGETVPGNGFAVIDLPNTSYIDALVNRSEWADGQIMKGVRDIFWLLGPGVVHDSRLQDFMKKMSSVKHIVTSADTCPNMIAIESAATQAYKLRCIDADRFPLPNHSNARTLSGTATANESTYQSGRAGKTIKLSPEYMHEDDKIVPFPNLKNLARQDLDSDDIWKMADQAKSKISDPDFIANVEKVEADIPNRDAEIISLGTGSALPSKYRNVSATLVRVPGYGNYLLDAGENTLGQMRRVFGDELPSVLRDLKVIWISHLHADHHLGTVSVIRAWHEETIGSDPSAKLVVASHGHMIDWLREYADVEDFGFERLIPKIFGRHDSQPRNVELRKFNSEEAKQFGLSQLEACSVTHCFGALAVAFTFPSGLKIAYSGDCRPSDAFVRIGQGATLLIHESTFDDELQGDAIAKKHSTMSEAIDIGRRMGARRILLTHFSQRYQKVPNLEEDLEIPTNTHIKDKTRADEVILVAFDYMRLKLGDFRKAQAFLPAIQKLLEEADQ
ncbi:hypothetical protein F5Y14DRAFT_412965 [Nemania sp. NC0429]|nr:hypothetical protein F5Y14DRAFT_412965 [Nemania sp. NC0429]